MKKRFLLIENIKVPIILELQKQPHKEGYITINKADLANNIPLKLRKILAQRGLASNEEIGMKTNKRFCWHRLVACLYYNCIGRFVHHIYKNSLDTNDITNLIVVDEKQHKSIDNDKKNCIRRGLKIQKILKDELFKQPKQTLANNDNIILKILELKKQGHSNKKIIKKLQSKIKQTKIYEHVKTFFYVDDFLKWLESKQNKPIHMLNEKTSKRWRKIIAFEGL